MSLRFLHVFPSFEAGGAQLRVINTINHVGPGGGHGILCIDGNTAASYRLDPACEAPVYKTQPRTGAVSFLLALRRQLRELSPQVLITYNWGSTDAIIAAMLNRMSPVIHNECGFSNEFGGFKWRRAAARRVLLNGIYKTVVTAESLEDMVLHRFGVNRAKVQLIRTGVDVVKFHRRRNDEMRAAWNVPPGGVVFGFMGGLRASKNVAMLIRCFAAANRPQDRLVLFGEGPLRGELEALVTQLGVAGRVIFHGHAANVADCYAAIDIYATSTLSEAASNSLLEAMATARPAIVTGIADNGVLLGAHQREFVIAPGDEIAYTKALAAMAANEDLRQRLGAENRRRCEANYDLQRMFAEYAQLWDSAAALAQR
jgi:glycosyltransferase involved in cell wall biosynthesis